MPKSPYSGGKQGRHVTLSDEAYAHLTAIAQSGGLSRSETLERLIRSTEISDGECIFSDEVWPFVVDRTINNSSPIDLSVFNQ